MYSLYKVIEDLCDSRGITVQTMSKDIGLHRNVMPRLRSDPDKELSLKTIKKIAAYFNVTTDYLLDLGEPSQNDIPPLQPASRDQVLFALYKEVPEEITDEEMEEIQQYAEMVLLRKRTQKAEKGE